MKIGPITYSISVDPTQWKLQAKDDQIGLADHTTASIYLDPDQNPDVMRLTLWHEILHAANEAMMGQPDWANLGKDPSAREETVVRMWEAPTLTILRENPALVAYLTAGPGATPAPEIPPPGNIPPQGNPPLANPTPGNPLHENPASEI